ncbi:MAG: radical SAM protein [Bacteroidales bacterium]|nr:radical SAM protein [Bacteroidales bacterium]
MLVLQSCTICPRECRVNRIDGEKGYCGTDAGLNIASVCLHRGEEPLISGADGICNIFFAGCNLRCIYCQNHEISQNSLSFRKAAVDLPDLLNQISEIISQGTDSVGFVSPSHMVHNVRAIIEGLHEKGLKPVIVYNTNSYDKADTLRSLEGLIDVYLPDYKYVTPALAAEFSGAHDYPEVALKAIREMYYQKGSTLRTDERGKAENGILIRHLVLPGYAEESMKVLRSIAEEISTGVHISLMSQYHPEWLAETHPSIGRLLYKEEYESVVEEMERLGFRNGYIQDMESNVSYRPDFSKEHPFE